VLSERPAWEAFGPQGEEVMALFAQIRTVTKAQARAMSNARVEQDRNNDPAWRDTCTMISRASLPGREAARRTVGIIVQDAAQQTDFQYDVRQSAEAAVMATLTRDLISSAEHDLLTHAWRTGRAVNG